MRSATLSGAWYVFEWIFTFPPEPIPALAFSFYRFRLEFSQVRKCLLKADVELQSRRVFVKDRFDTEHTGPIALPAYCLLCCCDGIDSSEKYQKNNERGKPFNDVEINSGKRAICLTSRRMRCKRGKFQRMPEVKRNVSLHCRKHKHRSPAWKTDISYRINLHSVKHSSCGKWAQSWFMDSHSPASTCPSTFASTSRL